jgi:hypothetical protein
MTNLFTIINGATAFNAGLKATFRPLASSPARTGEVFISLQ